MNILTNKDSFRMKLDTSLLAAPWTTRSRFSFSLTSSVSSWPPDSASLFGLDLGHYRVDAHGLEQHPVEGVEGLGRHDVHANPGHQVQSLLKLRPQLGLEVEDTSVKTLDNIVQLIWEVCPFRP